VTLTLKEKKAKPSKRANKNLPRYDLTSELYRICGIVFIQVEGLAQLKLLRLRLINRHGFFARCGKIRRSIHQIY